VLTFRELPPTAGLPLSWRDFLPAGGRPDLESGLARFLNVRSVQIECSGTAALVVALEYLKQRSKRRTVIVPAYTCPLVALAVARAGLRLKLCDLLRESQEMDANLLDRLCDSDTLAIIPTHLGGMPVNMEPLVSIARDHGAFLVEDAAQSLGATWRGMPVGTIGDIGVYSLTRGKGLTINYGGVLVAKSDEARQGLLETSKRLSASRPFLEAKLLVELLGYWLLYNPTGLSLVYGLPLRSYLRSGNLTGAAGDDLPLEVPVHKVGAARRHIGAAALARLPAVLEANRERGRSRAAALKGLPGVKVLSEPPDSSGSWPFLTVLLESSPARDQALSRLWTSGLGVTRLFVHDLTGYRYLSAIVPPSAVPNAQDFAARMLTISNSAWVTDRDFARIQSVLASSSAPAAKARTSMLL